MVNCLQISENKSLKPKEFSEPKQHRPPPKDQKENKKAKKNHTKIKHIQFQITSDKKKNL